MFTKIVDYIRRPLVNEQNTGREAQQQYNGYAFAAYNGNGGFTVHRSMNACNPATFTPGNTLKKNDPFVTGNLNVNLELQPLSTDNTILPVITGAQF